LGLIAFFFFYDECRESALVGESQGIPDPKGKKERRKEPNAQK
jgi:hypothetical protein